MYRMFRHAEYQNRRCWIYTNDESLSLESTDQRDPKLETWKLEVL